MIELRDARTAPLEGGGSAARDKYKTVGLLDHMGFGNMGDAAVLESFIQNIKERLPDSSLTAFSQNPEDTRKRHNLPSYPIRWWYPSASGLDGKADNRLKPPAKIKAFLKQRRILYGAFCRFKRCFKESVHLYRSYQVVKTLDILVMAGGGQLCELWGDMPYNFFKFCVLARLSRTPLVIIGVGAGPLERRLSKFFARWSVRLAEYASFRDIESQGLIRGLGVETETHVCPDPAYGIHLPDYMADEPSRKFTGKVGVNPMRFCDPRFWPRKDGAVYEAYLEKLTAFSSWLLGRGYSVEIFTSDIGTDDDAIADLTRRLVAAVPGERRPGLVSRPVLTLQELLVQMASFDFVITPKFHGVVFSHLLEKPVIALSYHRKIDDLMRKVGHEQYCLNIEHFDVESLAERFESVVRNSAELRSRFRNAVVAYKHEVKACFDTVFGGGSGEKLSGVPLVHALANDR